MDSKLNNSATSITGNREKILGFLLKQDDTKIFELKEKKAKRTLDQNSYFYKLQTELAKVLRKSNDELHLELLRDYSSVILVTLPSEENPQGYFKYYEKYQEGTIKNKEVIQYKVYKPSSEMNTVEFTRLLDGLIYECKQVGIETLTPNEILAMRSLERN